MLLEVFKTLPGEVGTQIGEAGRGPPFGFRPVQFVDVMPRTFEQRSISSRRRSKRKRPGAVHYQEDPATERFPLALISPASDKTISSTLGELPRPESRS